MEVISIITVLVIIGILGWKMKDKFGPIEDRLKKKDKGIEINIKEVSDFKERKISQLEMEKEKLQNEIKSISRTRVERIKDIDHEIFLLMGGFNE